MFDQAAAFVRRTDTGVKPSQEDQLAFYALYKQATEGDASGAAPGMLDFKGRAKHDAWAAKKGLTKDQAKEQYIAALNKLCPDWQSK